MNQGTRKEEASMHGFVGPDDGPEETVVSTKNEAAETCPYCDRFVGGSHYHCPRCGDECSMMGHWREKPEPGYTCEPQDNEVTRRMARHSLAAIPVADRQEEPATDCRNDHDFRLTTDFDGEPIRCRRCKCLPEREARVPTPLDVERLAAAIRFHFEDHTAGNPGDHSQCAEDIAARYARLSNQPSTEPAP